MIVPLAAKPDLCHDAITPNDMYTSQSCAWSGALLLFGGMGIVSWGRLLFHSQIGFADNGVKVLMRSLYTHLRVVWGLELPRWYPLLSHAIGWALPGLGLAVSIPVTGVSYQVGPLCLLNKTASYATFFGWYLTFSAIAGLLQLSTTTYCLWIYVRSFRETTSQQSNTEPTTETSVDEVMKKKVQDSQTVSGMYKKKHGWRRVKKVLMLQWRSIVLSMLVVASAIYFGAVYVVLSKTTQLQVTGANDAPAVLDWATCVVVNQGDKNACLDLAARFGVTEGGATAAFLLLAVSGSSKQS